ncbi:MAG: thermonuclease family protein [Verrucomicrobiota bacterium]
MKRGFVGSLAFVLSVTAFGHDGGIPPTPIPVEEVLKEKWSSMEYGKVVGIVDGDTVDLLTDEKKLVRIRLHGIDAPERGQDFGKRAKQQLSDLAFSRRLHFHYQTPDFFGREVATIFDGDRDLNLAMVESGFAWHAPKYLKSDDYALAQTAAEESKLGLWAANSPMNPSDFRRRPSVEKRERVEIDKPSAARRIPGPNWRLSAYDRLPVQPVRFQARQRLFNSQWTKADQVQQYFWLNTNAKPPTRHVRGGCFRFENTEKGRFGAPEEGKLCGTCARMLKIQEKSPPPQ